MPCPLSVRLAFLQRQDLAVYEGRRRIGGSRRAILPLCSHLDTFQRCLRYWSNEMR